MRGLVALTVVMGVMILAGVGVVAVTIMHRMGGGRGGGAVGNTMLDEPAGTHIVAAAANGARLTVVLTGGGPDRVVVIGPDGGVIGRVGLAR